MLFLARTLVPLVRLLLPRNLVSQIAAGPVILGLVTLNPNSVVESPDPGTARSPNLLNFLNLQSPAVLAVAPAAV